MQPEGPESKFVLFAHERPLSHSSARLWRAREAILAKRALSSSLGRRRRYIVSSFGLENHLPPQIPAPFLSPGFGRGLAVARPPWGQSSSAQSRRQAERRFGGNSLLCFLLFTALIVRLILLAVRLEVAGSLVFWSVSADSICSRVRSLARLRSARASLRVGLRERSRPCESGAQHQPL